MEIRVTHCKKNYEFLLNSDKRVSILYGSAGSGKSWAIAQYLLFEKVLKERNIRILCARKYTPALKKSVWLLFNDLIAKYNIPNVYINKNDFIIRIGTNEIYFTPLDDVNKLKSFEKINYVWVEEATEIVERDYIQLNLRCRGENTNPGSFNKLFYSFNPVDENSFFKPLTDNPPESVDVCHSTYRDNPFLDPEYVAEIEALKEQDITYWKIYGEGVWATPQNLIFSNWDIRKASQWIEETDTLIYGLDFGFNNQTALIELVQSEDG